MVCICKWQLENDILFRRARCISCRLPGLSLRENTYDYNDKKTNTLRGSDPDAAVFYLAKMLEAGDLIAACRRLLCSASEDVGMAYPSIIPIVKAAVDSALQLGMPEARLPLSNAAILIATAPKSNSACLAIDAAISDIHQGKGINVPRQLQNTHYDGKDAKVKGQNYKYPHDYSHHWVKQQYLPDDVKDRKIYNPSDHGFEKTIQERQAKRAKGENFCIEEDKNK